LSGDVLDGSGPRSAQLALGINREGMRFSRMTQELQPDRQVRLGDCYAITVDIRPLRAEDFVLQEGRGVSALPCLCKFVGTRPGDLQSRPAFVCFDARYW
jgi:hypothetical protein